MKLTKPERDILAGAHGSALQKALASVVRFGDVFGAVRQGQRVDIAENGTVTLRG
ncbi:MAG TPA: hypothetical protein PKJ16_03200 [Spirochaetota bacterium]|nr:hypothetical protein [Spirochaetota bacterium]HPU89447.1 hypothetical protein [Spirochaetota bacterium]